MMNAIITPQQVISLAFGEGEYLSSNIVTQADIVAAQERYIVPILGERLVARLADGEYQELAEEYLAPVIALATRLLVQPAVSLRMGDSGLVAPRGDTMEPPQKSAVDALMLSLKKRVRMLLRRLSRYLDSNAARYPEYDSKCNVLNRCSIDGGFVQIF